MLVINNKLHHRFIPTSHYLEYRNGVDVTQKNKVLLVISEERVNFDEFGRFFRDDLKTPDAFFLNGSISSLYAPEMRRADWLHALGTIITVIIGMNDKIINDDHGFSESFPEKKKNGNIDIHN